MCNSIDDNLDAAFTPERIIQAFLGYKYTKWDHFSGFEEPDIQIPLGADGVRATAFEKQLNRNAQNISRRIHEDSYIFYPFREVDKKKDHAKKLTPENTRTLGIASIRDALVQMILYKDVLYERIESLFSTLDQPCPVSYAYRRGKSAPEAARTVYDYIQVGYKYVLDADLSKYFDTIPHERLLERLAQIIGGDSTRTFRLVRRFAHTDRVPHRSYKHIKRNDKHVGYKVFHYRKPVPNRSPDRQVRDKGVPQGGVLSGMLANLYLHDFDVWVLKELGGKFDLKYIRYADDFIIMVKSRDDLPIIRQHVRERLSDLKLVLNEGKTEEIDVCKNGLDFVGFNFNGKHMRVKEKNIKRYKDRIQSEICEPPTYIVKRDKPKVTLKWLARRVNLKIQGLSSKEPCPFCGQTRLGPPRSWMAFFKVVTDIDQLSRLDKWTRQFVYDYIYIRHHIRIQRRDLRNAGFKSLVNERWRVGNLRLIPCICDIEVHGVWRYSRDLFQGKEIVTLAFRRPFQVFRVDANEILLSVGGNHYSISRLDFETLWNRLVTNQHITRAELERDGYQSTSQIVALLAELPGVDIQLWPIQLIFACKYPADFMIPGKSLR